LTAPELLFQPVMTRAAACAVVHSAKIGGQELRFSAPALLLHPCFTRKYMIQKEFFIWRFFDQPDWQA
jgi:hypothetical protein